MNSEEERKNKENTKERVREIQRRREDTRTKKESDMSWQDTRGLTCQKRTDMPRHATRGLTCHRED